MGKHLGHSTGADPQGVGAFARGLRCRFGNTPNSTQSVEAEWVSYGRLRCRTPPWDGFTDDDPHLGGYQVTLFITNDAQLFVPGTQAPGNASVQTPKGYPAADVPGTGVTFTYFGDEPFRDAHTFKGSGIDDIEVYGEYRGDGLGFFEVQVDGLAPDTYRWRFHPGEYNASSTADWPDHRLQVPTGEAFELATGISAAFLNGETTGSQDCEVRESMFYGLYGLSMGGFENGARSGGCRSETRRRSPSLVRTPRPWVPAADGRASLPWKTRCTLPGGIATGKCRAPNHPPGPRRSPPRP